MSDSSTHSAAGHAGPAILSPPVTARQDEARHASSVLLDSLFILPFGCGVALLWANTLPEMLKGMEFKYALIQLALYHAKTPRLDVMRANKAPPG